LKAFHAEQARLRARERAGRGRPQSPQGRTSQ
jgi:hypothetical protein